MFPTFLGLVLRFTKALEPAVPPCSGHLVLQSWFGLRSQSWGLFLRLKGSLVRVSGLC